MDIQPITMEQEAAQQAFREYRAAFMAERNRIDGELMRGYKMLAKGTPLLKLSEAIQKGGEDDHHRPRLAIARADERTIQVERWQDGRVQFSPGWNIRAKDRVFDLPAGTLPPLPSNVFARGASALVPLVPPRFRPPHAIKGYHILWEADWKAAPRDPALLKHIGGDLWAVLATWDLTDLERAVLERR